MKLVSGVHVISRLLHTGLIVLPSQGVWGFWGVVSGRLYMLIIPLFLRISPDKPLKPLKPLKPNPQPLTAGGPTGSRVHMFKNPHKLPASRFGRDEPSAADHPVSLLGQPMAQLATADVPSTASDRN